MSQIRIDSATLSRRTKWRLCSRNRRDNLRNHSHGNISVTEAAGQKIAANSRQPFTSMQKRMSHGSHSRLPIALDERVSGLRVRHRDGETALAGYVSGNPLLDGAVMLHRGAIVFEAYPRMEPWERHFAWSVSKVLTAATLAVLVAQGRIDMAAPVERYLPALGGSAWAGTPVQSIADMASGIDCLDSDGYQNPDTCIYQLEESLGITADTGREPDFIGHLRSMSRLRPAGSKNEYVSANTAVLGQVIEAVTDKPFAEAVQARCGSPRPGHHG